MNFSIFQFVIQLWSTNIQSTNFGTMLPIRYVQITILSTNIFFSTSTVPNLRPLMGVLQNLGGPEFASAPSPVPAAGGFGGGFGGAGDFPQGAASFPQDTFAPPGLEPGRSEHIPVPQDFIDALNDGFFVADDLRQRETTGDAGIPVAAAFPASDVGVGAGSAGAAGAAGGDGGIIRGTSSRPPRLEQSAILLFNFRRAQPEAKRTDSCEARLLLEASKAYLDRFNISIERAQPALNNLNTLTDNSACNLVPSGCQEPLVDALGERGCPQNAPYRTHDGTCNNILNPEWGSTFNPFVRYLAPAYEDGVDEMRGWGRFGPRQLPSPRAVSLAMQNGEERPPQGQLTLLVMQWGQFLDHDIVHTPEAAGVDDNGEPEPLECCTNGIPVDPIQDPANNCRNIDVTFDPLHTSQGRSCMRFVRSLLASQGCLLSPREQVNQITAYIDGSMVYGSMEEEVRDLREFVGGRLKSSLGNFNRNSPFLPTDQCEETITNGHCYKAGDVRVNEQPGLTSMHTLWLRVHQDIVTRLAQVNTHWDDEMLYQEGRRIVGALIQQTTYREFLPIVLGNDVLLDYNLLPLTPSQSSPTYDPNIDASVANVFATAAYRFGHTLVNDILRGTSGKIIPLTGNFNDASSLLQSGSHPTDLLLGLASSPAQPADSFLVPTLSNKLFAKPEEPVGLDLMSLNIQRGRDHGLPAYTVWRRACGLSIMTNFNDLTTVMSVEAARSFASVYKHVDDIDLFPAALAERPFPGALLGPTFTCILAQQFSNLKNGDRFWYQNSQQPKPFSRDQLQSLDRLNLATLMCNYLQLPYLQQNPFLASTLQGNEPRQCSTYASFDPEPWREITPPPVTPTYPSIPTYTPTYRPPPTYTPTYRPPPTFTPTYRPPPTFTPTYRPPPTFTPTYRPPPTFTPTQRPTPTFRPTPSQTPFPIPQPGSVKCKGVGIWGILPGMDKWCYINCNHLPPYCPATHCNCYI